MFDECVRHISAFGMTVYTALLWICRTLWWIYRALADF